MAMVTVIIAKLASDASSGGDLIGGGGSFNRVPLIAPKCVIEVHLVVSNRGMAGAHPTKED